MRAAGRGRRSRRSSSRGAPTGSTSWPRSTPTSRCSAPTWRPTTACAPSADRIARPTRRSIWSSTTPASARRARSTSSTPTASTTRSRLNVARAHPAQPRRARRHGAARPRLPAERQQRRQLPAGAAPGGVRGDQGVRHQPDREPARGGARHGREGDCAVPRADPHRVPERQQHRALRVAVSRVRLARSDEVAACRPARCGQGPSAVGARRHVQGHWPSATGMAAAWAWLADCRAWCSAAEPTDSPSGRRRERRVPSRTCPRLWSATVARSSLGQWFQTGPARRRSDSPVAVSKAAAAASIAAGSSLIRSVSR